MKGHIRERSPGKWAIILDVRDPATGKRRRKWHSFSGTKREAQIECARYVSAMAGGAYQEPAKITVAQYLERWVAHIASQVAPRTHERYAEIAFKNVVPLLGAVPLTRLRPEQISAAYTKALASGRRDGAGGLSPRTVHHMHRILRQALAEAVRWRLLMSNPADLIKPPKVERSSMHTYDLPETAALIHAARGTRMLIPTVLAVLCGLRRGEILALRWRHLIGTPVSLPSPRAWSRRVLACASKKQRAVGRGLSRSQEPFSTNSGPIGPNKRRNYCDLASVFRPKR